MLGYLTVPGVVLAVIGVVSGVRRHRAATAVLGVWTLDACSPRRCCSPLWPYPRYFAAAIVPLSAFVALGAVGRLGHDRRRHAGCAAAGASPWPASCCSSRCTPALRYEGAGARRSRAHAVSGRRPHGLRRCDQRADVGRARRGARSSAAAAPIRCRSASRADYTWGLDLRLNGTAVGSRAPLRRLLGRAGRHGDQRDAARADPRARATSISDGAPSAAPPRAGLPPDLQQGAPLQRVRHAPLRAHRA